jgi:hypothetical protein
MQASGLHYWISWNLTAPTREYETQNRRSQLWTLIKLSARLVKYLIC